MTSYEERLPNHEKLFIPFIMSGDPSPELTIKIALMLEEAGASVLELGVPYSDPLADGPVIQRASKRALAHEMTITKTMTLAGEMRRRGLKIPIILFTYFNPVLQLGEVSFFALAKQNGIDGLLVPDLPFEESEHLRKRCKENTLTYISLVAPTSKQRMKRITENAQGFLYCISSLGVTGVRNDFSNELHDFLSEVKNMSNVPTAVGFGISSSKQIEALKSYCDGFVVGSAIIKMTEDLENQFNVNEEQTLIEFKQKIEELISPLLAER
ncbi:tryptophan synthase subunit alpha [Sutcliffiella rhizosphaerae]|uniref:Tryptophan synthase alpha chain n=1 Tax=Sutcliffiella rhizosphaerae TaxID=2880967 RepID=A0ABM8YRR2_9BACI|nr:tryptophan synthase subunit alpha [Sutcliffiella rhizosphaerae]CAG9622648.1 Tryptophan synthase alpha chain [Sutcliffiella rhizosphaerae]